MRCILPEHQLLPAHVHVLLRSLCQILLQHLPLERAEEAGWRRISLFPGFGRQEEEIK